MAKKKKVKYGKKYEGKEVLKDVFEVEPKEVKKSFQMRCVKVVNRTKVNEKEEYVEICGKFSEGHRLLEAEGLIFRLDLCREHVEEFEKKEREKKEKEKKDFVETEMICPKCGEKVFKHFHQHDQYPSQTYEWRWFWCKNMCDLDCGVCILLNSNGECEAFSCYNKSRWNPIKFIKKIEVKVD